MARRRETPSSLRIDFSRGPVKGALPGGEHDRYHDFVTYDQPELERRNPLISNDDILRYVMPFARGEGYLFVASTSRHWHRAWGDEPRRTGLKAAGETVNRVKWAMASSLEDRHALAVSVEAARCGRLDVLKEIFASGMDEAKLYVAAAKAGQLAVVKWIKTKSTLCFPGPWACAAAAWGGHLDVLKWCRANGLPWDANICKWAARGGNLELLQWCMISRCSRLDHSDCLLGVGAGGNVAMAKWAKAEGLNFSDTMMCYSAAAEGHLEMLKWAREAGIDWKSETMVAAAYGGHLEVLKWCRTNGCQWNGKEAIAAASQGHLELLQWVTTHGCPWDWRTMAAAAGARFRAEVAFIVRPPWLHEGHTDGHPIEEFDPRGGHLEVLKWCRSNGCSWNEFAYVSAACRGHVDVLKWLWGNGCPWHSGIINFCRDEGNEEALEWCKAVEAT